MQHSCLTKQPSLELNPLKILSSIFCHFFNTIKCYQRKYINICISSQGHVWQNNLFLNSTHWRSEGGFANDEATESKTKNKSIPEKMWLINCQITVNSSMWNIWSSKGPNIDSFERLNKPLILLVLTCQQEDVCAHCYLFQIIGSD